MNGLAVPVMHQFGRRPAAVKGTKNPIAPLTINKDLDKLGVLKGVTTFTFHLHLPHCSYIGQAADRPVPSASVHGGGKPGVQFVHLNAAEGHTRRPYPAGRLDRLHHVVWWHR